MKKALCIFSIFLFAAAAAFGQEAKLPKDFVGSYDKFKDTTTIYRKHTYVRGTGKTNRVGALQFQPTLMFAGEKIARDEDARFGMMFRSISIMCDGYCFIRRHGLIVIADGVKFDLGDGNWQSGARDEQMYYAVTRDQLTTIANAKSVEFQLGPFEGKFGEKETAAVKTILDLGTAR